MNEVRSGYNALAASDVPGFVTKSVEVFRLQPADTSGSRVPERCGESGALAYDAALTKLSEQLDSLLPPSSPKVVAFIGPKGGEGVTTLVQDFACCATRRQGKTVLILQQDWRFGGRRETSNDPLEAERKPGKDLRTARSAFGYGGSPAGVSAAEPKGEKAGSDRNGETIIYQIKGLKLYVLNSPLADITSPILERIVNCVGGQLNLVVIDCSRAAGEQMPLRVSPGADGVVVVLDVNNIDSNATESLLAELRGLGARILGIVLNRAVLVPKREHGAAR